MSLAASLPCSMLKVLHNQTRKLWHLKHLLHYLLLTLTVFTIVSIKMKYDFLDQHEQRQVTTYLRWWNEVCNNSSRQLQTRLDKDPQALPLCPCVAEVPFFKEEMDIITMFEKNRSVLPSDNYKKDLTDGGHWKPTTCHARQRLAIIIPYRNRQEHLDILLPYLHPFLQTQQIEYQIFIIEQMHPSIFNRAALMNIGYLEAQSQSTFDCFIFHDVDLLPLDARNAYACFRSPTHLGAYMNKFDYELPYDRFFGGAVAISREHLISMNGFSNRYFGWGGEDDDTYNRVLWRNLTIHRHPQPIGKSYMFKHEEDKGNPINPKRDIGYTLDPDQYMRDGITSIMYIRHQRDSFTTHTRVLVSIEKEHLSECIVNISQPPTLSGNYVECLDEQNYIDGNVDCCRGDDGRVSCCRKSYGYPAFFSANKSPFALWLGAALGVMVVFAVVVVIKSATRRIPNRISEPVQANYLTLNRIKSKSASLKNICFGWLRARVK